MKIDLKDLILAFRSMMCYLVMWGDGNQRFKNKKERNKVIEIW